MVVSIGSGPVENGTPHRTQKLSYCATSFHMPRNRYGPPKPCIAPWSCPCKSAAATSISPIAPSMVTFHLPFLIGMVCSPSVESALTLHRPLPADHGRSTTLQRDVPVRDDDARPAETHTGLLSALEGGRQRAKSTRGPRRWIGPAWARSEARASCDAVRAESGHRTARRRAAS